MTTRKVRWGVIGAGGIADRRTIPGILQSSNAELIAVAGTSADSARVVAAKYGVPDFYDNEDDLLANPQVEAVYIATPVAAHHEQAAKAARLGKHILLEKPLALTAAQSAELVDLCDERGVLFAAGMMMRFHRDHVKAKQLISSGALGQLVSARAQLTCWYPAIPGAWRQTATTAGGGALMDMGIHCIDLLQFISGSRVTGVMAMTGTKTFAYDVEDSASVVMEFDNGAYGYVDTNFNIPDDAAQCRLEFYGTKGSILAHGTIGQEEAGQMSVTLSDASGYDAIQSRADRATDMTSDLTAGEGDLYEKEITSFGRSILSGTPAEVPAADAVQVQSVIESAYRSSGQGRYVSVSGED